MKILNLGCGTRTSSHPSVDNIDFSIKLRIRKNSFLRAIVKPLASSTRMKSIASLPDNIRLYNLKKGIPYESDSVDVIFHSHLIEHIDRSYLIDFINENMRVLKSGGILRVVFPDMETLCQRYLNHILQCDNEMEAREHERYIEAIIGQIARTESYSTSQQPPVLRKIENLLLGDARRKGEAHMWMYDRISLTQILKQCGFKEVQTMRYNESAVIDWQSYALDINLDGTEYKPMSQYLEATK